MLYPISEAQKIVVIHKLISRYILRSLAALPTLLHGARRDILPSLPLLYSNHLIQRIQSSAPQFQDSTFTHSNRNDKVIPDMTATVAKCGRQSTMLLLLNFHQKKHKLWKKTKKPSLVSECDSVHG